MLECVVTDAVFLLSSGIPGMYQSTPYFDPGDFNVKDESDNDGWITLQTLARYGWRLAGAIPVPDRDMTMCVFYKDASG